MERRPQKVVRLIARSAVVGLCDGIAIVVSRSPAPIFQTRRINRRNAVDIAHDTGGADRLDDIVSTCLNQNFSLQILTNIHTRIEPHIVTFGAEARNQTFLLLITERSQRVDLFTAAYADMVMLHEPGTCVKGILPVGIGITVRIDQFIAHVVGQVRVGIERRFLDIFVRRIHRFHIGISVDEFRQIRKTLPSHRTIHRNAQFLVTAVFSRNQNDTIGGSGAVNGG